MDGETRSFSALARDFSGDIPPRAIADELARVGAIEILPDGKLRLVARAYIPRGDQAAKITILGSNVADLIRTIDHNLTCPPGEAYFQRRVTYDNIPQELLPELTQKLSRKAQACREQLDRLLAAADRDRSPAVKGSGRVRTGVGIYYFEERIELGVWSLSWRSPPPSRSRRVQPRTAASTAPATVLIAKRFATPCRRSASVKWQESPSRQASGAYSIRTRIGLPPRPMPAICAASWWRRRSRLSAIFPARSAARSSGSMPHWRTAHAG